MPAAIPQNMPVYRRSESFSPPEHRKSGYIDSLRQVHASPEKPVIYQKTTSVAPEAVEKGVNQSSIDPSQEKVRTATECLVDIIALLQIKGVEEYNRQPIDSLRHAFLSGKFTHSDISYLKDIKFQCAPGASDAEIKLLRSQTDNILASHDTQMNLFRRYDNFYGRLFDSFFASKIIHHPSDEMLKATQYISAAISCNFKFQHDASDKLRVCKSMKELLHADPPAWRDDIIEVNTFLQENTPENFINMLRSTHPLAHALTIHLAVKYLAEAPGCSKAKNDATAIYKQVIKPQRSVSPSFPAHPQSHYVGIMLRHQHTDNSFIISGKGIRPIDKIKLSSEKITPLNKKALASGSPVATGMSGSAHLLNYFFKSLRESNKKFPLEAAKLLSAAELTYSGGHSINEAYASFNLKENKHFQPLNYFSLCSQPVAEKAIDYAWQEMLKRAVKLNTPRGDSTDYSK